MENQKETSNRPSGNGFLLFLSGAVLTALSLWCLFVFELAPTTYANGKAAGHETGLRENQPAERKAGFAEGIAFIERKQQQTADSVARIADAKKAEQRRRAEAARRERERVASTQNWHVIDGKIADPIYDQ